MKSALLVILALLATPVAAEECSQIADPLAFNACLARQGPAARAVRMGAAPAQAGASWRRARAPAAVYRRRGRSEMVFSAGK